MIHFASTSHLDKNPPDWMTEKWQLENLCWDFGENTTIDSEITCPRCREILDEIQKSLHLPDSRQWTTQTQTIKLGEYKLKIIASAQHPLSIRRWTKDKEIEVSIG